MDGRARVGVVIPVRNGARHLEAAVRSILGQSYPHLTVVVVDDGSSDGSGDIARALAAEDERVRVVRCEGIGPGPARNAGIAALTDERYVAAMDADDIAHVDRIERQLRAAEAAPEVLAWGCRMTMTTDDDRVLGSRSVGPTTVADWQARRERGELVMLVGSTIFCRRADLDRVGGYADVLLCDDFDLSDRLAALGPVLELEDELVRYRMHDAGISHARFAEQSWHLRYVWDRAERRSRGEDVGTLEEFIAQCRRAPAPRRVQWWAQDRSRLHLRRAALARSSGRRVAALGDLAVASLLNPAYVTNRLWSRVAQPALQRIRSTRPDAAS